MRASVIIFSMLLVLSSIPSSQAGKATSVEGQGAVFGGVHVLANDSYNSSMSFDQMPAIVEDYTATWCTNCVQVEHALNDVEENESMQQYHFHRYINENEDPLGSQEGDDRWIARYDDRLPPTVIFNGTLMQIGSVPDSESLQNDFTSNLRNHPLNLGEGTSSLTYTAPTGESGAIVTWNLVVNMENFPANSTINSSIWVVEDVAYFPDGSNGENYYHESVRSIIELGSELSGTKEITLPLAYDGDDLEIHLIHEVILPEPEEEVEPKTPVEGDDGDDESSLPSISFVSVIAISMVAAITAQRKQQ